MDHAALVTLLIDTISYKWQEKLRILLVDHSASGKESKPPKIGGHFPDLYARIEDGPCIVGEAKTQKDFETRRSQEQLNVFLKYANDHKGIFFLAVPFVYHRAAARQLEYLANSNGYILEGYVVHDWGMRRLRCND